MIHAQTGCAGSREFTAATSPCCRRRFANAPRRTCCRRGFVRRWSRSWPKLPRNPADDLRRALRRGAGAGAGQGTCTHTARWLQQRRRSRRGGAGLQQETFNFEKALQTSASMPSALLRRCRWQAHAHLRAPCFKLHTSWRRLGGPAGAGSWVETGSSTPTARAPAHTCCRALSGSTLRVSLGELAGGKRVRIQRLEGKPRPA